MKIWIDLDNTPHVPFFRPIVRELERRGYSVILTARSAFQVCELADFFGLPYVKIGRHYGRNSLLKVLGVAWRSAQLARFCLSERPSLAISHGSRSQILLCNLLHVPNIMIMDYEHARTPWPMRPQWEIVPKALESASLHCIARERIATYDGIKEDVYVPDFQPDARIVDTLGLAGSIVATVRPPADEAHYHNPESDVLLARLMERLCATPRVKVVLVPRNAAQYEGFKRNWPGWFAGPNVVVPNGAVDGLNLLWYSDLVVSGGGTMNREAAALGIPVYSIFRGPIGAVDRQLQREGRLVLIGNIDDVAKILVQSRDRRAVRAASGGTATLHQIVDRIEAICRTVNPESVPARVAS